MGRAPCCDKANVKRGPWSPEEDELLKSYIEKNGTGGNWIALPRKAGLRRCGKSCRLRWLNYLRPNIKHGGFTEEEDKVICSLYGAVGSRWSVIASQLPGRTDNDVKNHWNTKLKKRMLAGSGETNPRSSGHDSENGGGAHENPVFQPHQAPVFESYYCGSSSSSYMDGSHELESQFLAISSRMVEASEFGSSNSHHSISSSQQEASSLSTLSSSSSGGFWAGGGGIQDDGMLLDLGFGNPYDDPLLNFPGIG